VLSPFTHPLFTAMIGIGAGVAVRASSKYLRVLAPIGGYVTAVLLHALWNASATLGTPQTFLNVYFLVMVPIFIAGLTLVSWHRRREQRIVARALPEMVDRGWVDPADVRRLVTLTARRRWRVQAGRKRGRNAAKAVGAYQAAVTELAFLWHAVRMGLAGGDAPDREARLVTVLHAARGNLPAKQRH
jgi:hypothetical protein